LEFYLPNFEDLVDPGFDFKTDSYSPSRKNRWMDDWYAHQFFPNQPIFDGMLVSRASIKPIAERHIREAGSMHQFVHLDSQIPIMGDCGAFTYLFEEKPVYSDQQVLDYYHEFGFDYGVSLDHLSFVTVDMLEKALKRGVVKRRWWTGKTDEQLCQERIDLTLQNACEFLKLCEQQQPCFEPIGIAQGGTPEMFYDSVQQLIAMGYDHIALGGLVKSSDEEILAILREIHPLVRNSVRLHIFGVARLSLVPEFVRLGVTSADSAAPLRRAFLGSGEDNYWTLGGGKYAAIRVPQARSERNRRGVDSPEEVLKNGGISQKKLLAMEREALRLLQAFDRDEATLERTLKAVLAYDRLHGIKRDYESAYCRTLQDRPWKRCGCPICESIGIDVIIFRGNNRNRRRGFHNVKVFYEQFRQEVQKAQADASDAADAGHPMHPNAPTPT
jgi:hypothetical protein